MKNESVGNELRAAAYNALIEMRNTHSDMLARTRHAPTGCPCPAPCPLGDAIDGLEDAIKDWDDRVASILRDEILIQARRLKTESVGNELRAAAYTALVEIASRMPAADECPPEEAADECPPEVT
jgi:hypothetical protein